MADAARARKLAVRIREIVASTLETQVKDPRLGMITITDSKVTPDLREATVFYTVYGDETAVTDTIAALDSARGVLRSAVGRQTGIKFTPTLDFVHDRIPDVARELAEALARAQAADAELAKVRDGATYAGDPDPYRVPRDGDSDDASDDDADDDSGGDADEESDDPAAFDPETETWTRRVGGEVDSARP